MLQAKIQFYAAVETNEFKLQTLEEQIKAANENSEARDEMINLMRKYLTDASPDKQKLVRKLAEHDRLIEE